MKTILTLVLTTLLATINLVNAAGFDCTKASSTTEKMICSNEVLSKLDEKNTQLFGQYKAIAIDVGLTIQDQRDWLKHTRNTCLDVICLEDVYQKRNAHLSSRIESNQLTQAETNSDNSATQNSQMTTQIHPPVVPVQSTIIDNTLSSGDVLVTEPAQQESAVNDQRKQKTPVTNNALPVPLSDTQKYNLTSETTKLTPFTAQYAKAISALILIIVLMLGLTFPLLVRKVF